MKAATYILLLAVALAGCGPSVPQSLQPPPPGPKVDVIAANHAAADELHKLMRDYETSSLPILVASFVNLDDLDETSTLGRMIAQQISSRLSTYGYPVIDSRIRSDALLVKEREGEFALSRRLADINSSYGAHAVLAGTYTVAYNTVFVSARVLRCTDGVILAASDYRLPYNPRALGPGGSARYMSAPIEPSVRTQF